MKTEQELLARLDVWLAEQETTPTIFDVMTTGDGELFAAFVLNGFREAARAGVVGRLERESATTFVADTATATATGAIFRVFDGLSKVWRLSDAEQLRLLGLSDARELQDIRAMPLQLVPPNVIARVVILLDIFTAINTLLPQAPAADAWVRRANRAPSFGGRSALDLMLDDMEGMQTVRSCLWAQVYAT